MHRGHPRQKLVIIFNIGVGLILSALFVFFRDIEYLWGVFSMLLMYLSAIFYTVDGFGERARLFLLNPLYCYIQAIMLLFVISIGRLY